MEQYEKLWQNSFASNQMVVDWDTFIQHFGKTVLQNASIYLSDIQKRYISGLIDPEHTNQVYKNAYLLFIKNFWNITSNRSRLFAMKLNMTKVVSRDITQPRSQDQLTLQIQWKNKQGQPVLLKYDVTPVAYRKAGSKQQPYPLKNQSFLSIGSAQYNDIVMESAYCNPTHLKIIHKELPKRQKRSFFAKKSVLQTSPWYVRDVSRSFRLKYWINNSALKYVILKKGMMLQMGICRDYLIIIDFVEELSKNSIDNLDISLNADNVDYLTGTTKPKKDIIDFNLTDLTPDQVINYFDQQVYYPKQTTPIKKKQTVDLIKQDDFQPVRLRLIYKPTEKVTNFDSKMKRSFTIGRMQSCDLVIQSISIRERECFIELINGVWTLRSDDMYLFLTSVSQSEQWRNSNRQKIIDGSQQTYSGQDFKVKVIVKSTKDLDSQFD